MEIRRKIVKPLHAKKELLEELMDEAETFDCSFIELRLNTRSEYSKMICGLEEARLSMSRAYGDTISSASGVGIVSDGVLDFLPDIKGVCWGYLLDTKSNRKWLAIQMKNAVVTISDKKIEDEVKELAKELGVATRKIARDASIDSGVSNSVLKELEADNAELREQLKKLIEMQEEATKVQKPLSGKKIKK